MTPLKYLKELILVDDASENRQYLREPLEKFIKHFPIPTKIVRSKKRLGLISARLFGSKEATGEILTFSDSHIEFGENWLPPLLHEIKKNRFEFFLNISFLKIFKIQIFLQILEKLLSLQYLIELIQKIFLICEFK